MAKRDLDVRIISSGMNMATCDSPRSISAMCSGVNKGKPWGHHDPSPRMWGTKLCARTRFHSTWNIPVILAIAPQFLSMEHAAMVSIQDVLFLLRRWSIRSACLRESADGG